MPRFLKRRIRFRRRQSRGAAVVQTVLEATLDELIENGYQALSFKRIAKRAGVARTTVYRRYPSRLELVLAAIRSNDAAVPPPSHSGDVRADLIEIVKQAGRFAQTRHGVAVMRLFSVDKPEPELALVLAQVRKDWDQSVRSVIRQRDPTSRFESSGDFETVCDLIPAAIFYRVVVQHRTITPNYSESLVDTVLSTLSLKDP